MACGVPVVASRVGGLPEVVQHGKTGYLTEVGDIQGMSEGVLKLLTNDLLFKTFSEQAVIWARKTFPVERAVESYETVYRDAIRGS
jgi:glycosyltransferase involved in cell wall biosynthesis